MKSQTTIGTQIILYGAPFLMLVLSLLHPISHSDSIIADLQPQLDLWFTVHLLMLVVIGLLGVALWLLVDGLDGIAAQVARVAVVIFVPFYAAFDAIVGISTGLLVRFAGELGGGEPMNALVEHFWDARLEITEFIAPLILTGGVAWLVAVLAVALAYRQHGASWWVVLAFTLAGLVFAIDHPWPTGSIGMAALLVGVHLSRRQAGNASGLPAPDLSAINQ